MRSIYSPPKFEVNKFRCSPPKIPITRDSAYKQIRSTHQSSHESWNDLKKNIRDKVQSKLSGLENQKFFQKEDILYNFKNIDTENSYLKRTTSQPNVQLRASTAYIRNTLDNRFPKQESPIKMGLTRSIYSPAKRYNPQEIEAKYQNIQNQLQKERNPSMAKKSLLESSLMTRTKTLNERVTLGEIIRISHQLQDVQIGDIPTLSSGYLQELVGLQNNVGRILKNSSQKLYK